MSSSSSSTATQCACAVYVDMGLSSNSPIVLTAVTSGQSFERSFSVKVTQIECDSLSKGIQYPDTSCSIVIQRLPHFSW